jgi:hypothetical protein
MGLEIAASDFSPWISDCISERNTKRFHIIDVRL